jgi:thiamine transport system permease protein
LVANVLFAVPFLLMAVPLLAAFAPLWQGGLSANLARILTEPRFMRSFGFGLGQAGASTLLAVVLGLPGAYLLAMKRFPLKRLLAALTAVPFCVPPLIVAIGFVLFYGRSGWLNTMAMTVFRLSEPPLNFLYSFAGLVMTHGFYNFPLVVSMVGDAWSTTAASHEDAARLLGAGRLRVFWTITIPAIAPSIGAAASIVFLMCFFSFVIVLLFGGPGVATPEVELYRAARFEFDRSLASAFALVETLVAITVLWIYGTLERRIAASRQETGHPRTAEAFHSKQGAVLAFLYGLMILVFFMGPLAAIVAESFKVSSRVYGAGTWGFGNYDMLLRDTGFGMALVNTIMIGMLAATLATLAGFMLSVLLKRSRSVLVSNILPMLPLAISAVILAYGWSTILGQGTILTLAAVQAVSAYPFILRAVQGSIGQSDEQLVDAAMTLGSSRFDALVRVRLPLAMPAILTGFAFAFAISAGDANAIIVAPVPGMETMALLLYRLAGSYRFNAACAVAVVLAFLSGFVFFMKDHRHGQH